MGKLQKLGKCKKLSENDIDVGSPGFGSRAGHIGFCRHRMLRCVRCLGAEPWRWAPPLVTRIGVMLLV